MTLIFDKELQASMDESKRLEDIGKLFKNWDEANEALNLLIISRKEVN